MIKPAPHIIPYQGSKRRLAAQIINFMPQKSKCLYEPFAGSAAITLTAAANDKAENYVISDKLEPLSALWSMILNDPHRLIDEYSCLWNSQLSDPVNFYIKTRDEFNRLKTPSTLLYLIARCVKNSIRFNSSGDFNQGPDNRRLGMKPDKLKREIIKAHYLLNRNTSVQCGDFRDILRFADENDLVYMDPPWQGTSGKRDPRYAYLLNIDDLISELESLNSRNIPFILSFDGTCGDKTYGQELPAELKLNRVFLNAGRSSQATLLGRNEETVESLYLSPSLITNLNRKNIFRSTKFLQAEMF